MRALTRELDTRSGARRDTSRRAAAAISEATLLLRDLTAGSFAGLLAIAPPPAGTGLTIVDAPRPDERPHPTEREAIRAEAMAWLSDIARG